MADVERELMEPWSGKQIVDQIGPQLMKKGMILLYKDLQKYDTIEELLPGPKSFAVLYVAVNRLGGIGHWVVVLRNGRNIHFFDPLGMRPDRHLQWTKPHLRKRLGQDEPHLSDLLNDAVKKKYNVSFDETSYQQKDSNVCGRYVVARVKHLFSHPKGDEESFFEFVKRHLDKGEHPDELMVRLVDD